MDQLSQLLRDKSGLNPSEALMRFVIFLSTRSQKMRIGRYQCSGEILQHMKRFRAANRLDDLTAGWQDKVVWPSGRVNVMNQFRDSVNVEFQ